MQRQKPKKKHYTSVYKAVEVILNLYACLLGAMPVVHSDSSWKERIVISLFCTFRLLSLKGAFQNLYA